MIDSVCSGRKPRRAVSLVPLACTCVALLMLTGCLEQLQTTRIASGSLSNFLLHLQAGELDDARAYFAPGLVTPAAQLDESLKEAYRRLHAYEIKDKKSNEEDLGNGQVRERILGKVR